MHSITIIICLHSVIWFQVFLSITNNFYNHMISGNYSHSITTTICLYLGGARDVVVIAVGNGHGDTSSNPG